MATRAVLRGVVLLSVAASLGACDGGTVSVSVELRTDFVPGVEFVAVETFAEDATGRDEVAVFRTDDYASAARRVAELDGLAPSAARRVTVRLLDADRAEVARRTVVFEHQRDRAVAVLLTRRCRAVVCGPGESCFAGRCQSEACEGGGCVAECASPADCAAAGCAAVDCVTGACFAEPVAGACAAGSYCDPETGCVPDPAGPVDAGPGPTDAGADAGHDAGVDAGPPFHLRALPAFTSAWLDRATTGAVPSSPVRAAFSSNGEVVVAITDDAVQVLDPSGWRWEPPRSRAALFPELDGVAIWDAADVAGTDVLAIYAPAGVFEYGWDPVTRTPTFQRFVARADFGADWADPEAPPWGTIYGLFSHPDNANGWVAVDPRAECPGRARVGLYVAAIAWSGIGPSVPSVSIYDIECPFRFVEQRDYGDFPPFARAGAPSPESIEATVFIDDTLLAFE